MKAQQLLYEILAALKTLQENQEALEKIHEFIFTEIYEENDEEENDIPEKYQKAIHDIAESIDAGEICFVNTETLEFVDLVPELLDDPSEYEAITGESYDDLPFHNWENMRRIEPLSSNQSFNIMEQFVDELDDIKLRNKLE